MPIENVLDNLFKALTLHVYLLLAEIGRQLLYTLILYSRNYKKIHSLFFRHEKNRTKMPKFQLYFKNINVIISLKNKQYFYESRHLEQYINKKTQIVLKNVTLCAYKFTF